MALAASQRRVRDEGAHTGIGAALHQASGRVYDAVYAGGLASGSGAGSFEPAPLVGSAPDRIVISPAAELAEAVIVPDLRGMSLRKARRVAAEAGLVFSFEGSGRVRSQSPRAGAVAAPGNRVIASCAP